jgi:integration host factor subunit beta
MTKSELITAFAEEMGFSEKQARGIIDTILDGMAEAMALGKSIELRGFGTFKIKHYRPYIGRNPKTLERVKVKPKRLPFFKVGKELKAAVNNSRAGVA